MFGVSAVSKKDESKQGISKSQKHGSDMKKLIFKLTSMSSVKTPLTMSVYQAEQLCQNCQIWIPMEVFSCWLSQSQMI